jgi:hypothetical protein
MFTVQTNQNKASGDDYINGDGQDDESALCRVYRAGMA